MKIISSYLSGDLITITPIKEEFDDFISAKILLDISKDLKASQEKLHELGVPRERTFEDCQKDYDPTKCNCRIPGGYNITNNPYDLSQCSSKPQSGKNICRRTHIPEIGYYNKDFWKTNPKGEWDNGTKIFTK